MRVPTPWIVSLLSLLSAPALADRWLVLASNQGHLPAGLRAAVEARGATVQHELDAIGALVIEASADVAAAAAREPGVRSVVRDLGFAGEAMPFVADDQAAGDAAGAGLFPTETRLPLQWGYRVVHAGEAHAAGITGAGVRVAVIDSGADVTHPDLAPVIDRELSRSFVPGEPSWSPPPAVGLRFHHGTYVTSLLAAAANGVGLVGIAPGAEVVVVKVLRDADASGSFDDVLAGLVYSGTIHAQVVNLSLSGTFSRSGGCNEGGCWTAREVSEQFTALARATSYVRRQGGIIIASAGNGAIDLDHAADTLVLPTMDPHVVVVSATGPTGRYQALSQGLPEPDLDGPTTLSNTGARLVTLSAPGGNIDPVLAATTCFFPMFGTRPPCWALDAVLGAQQNGFAYAAGTSAAAPHVSGVAALIIEATGGALTPDQVEARLRESAEDRGKIGFDGVYGHGRVNARAALGE